MNIPCILPSEKKTAKADLSLVPPERHALCTHRCGRICNAMCWSRSQHKSIMFILDLNPLRPYTCWHPTSPTSPRYGIPLWSCGWGVVWSVVLAVLVVRTEVYVRLGSHSEKPIFVFSFPMLLWWVRCRCLSGRAFAVARCQNCYGMGCSGTYFTHAQTCDNVRV